MIYNLFQDQLKINKFSILLIASLLASCHSYKKNDSHLGVSDDSIKKGQLLAATYCQSCHLLPDPSLLDTKTWENDVFPPLVYPKPWEMGVLPVMGPYLGIFEYNFKVYPSNRNDINLPAYFYPSHPVINNEQWQNIIDYYTALSPDSLPPQKRSEPIQSDLTLFSIEIPDFKGENPTTYFIKIDTSVTPHQLWTADILKKGLYRFTNNLKLIDSLSTTGPIVGMSFRQNKIIACDIGILNPTNAKFGSAQSILRDANNNVTLGPVLFNKLQRPVQITSVDLNNDGKNDFLVCEFGYNTGALSWYQNMGNDQFERHTIREIPGAIKAYITDDKHNGLPDLWVLFAQGDEGIFHFINKGNGLFDQEEVLRFPPSYGSTYFEFDDFNKDGYPDILYTCGDNGDYSRILKPYHGVYIFLNDGKNHFKQKYFFPINGCYKAMACDFDGDGDLDIAAISYFADYIRQPEEGFVYLENKGNFNFVPFSLPQTKVGRWITMDVGDLDGDGKPDIVLGNGSIGATMERSTYNWEKGPPFIVLKNMGRKE